MTTELTIRRPDDWHLHLRDGAMLEGVIGDTSRHFARAIIMPNLVPPVVTTADASAYRDRILAALPEGAVVGTSSLRRQAQVKRVRPDLRVVGFRGNVQTRLGKLADGVADATLLACAGLNRLGLADRITSAIETETMLPAVAQGAIAIEIHTGDARTAELVAPLHHIETAIRVRAERAFLRRLEGSCRTAIAGLAEIAGDALVFRGMVFSPNGAECFEITRDGTIHDAEALGTAAADVLLERGAGALISETT